MQIFVFFFGGFKKKQYLCTLINNPAYMEQSKFDRVIKIICLLIAVMAVIHIGWLIYQGEEWFKVIFAGMQYLSFELIIFPSLLRKRLNVEFPWVLLALIVIYCFSCFILGDALNFYGIFTWWDDWLHIESGVLLVMIGMWLLRLALVENDKPIHFNRWILAIYLVLFSLGFAAFWEIVEFTLDGLFDINMQQFMASTTGTITIATDVPRCGREALYDTMIDVSYTLIGAVPTAIYYFSRYKFVACS